MVSRNLEPGDINGARLRNPSGGTREQRFDRGAHEIAVSWVARHNRDLTIVSASLCPILYLLFVNRYSTNSFYNDDWSVVMLVHSALHGGLSLSQLWGQYNESRLLLSNMMVVLFAFIDRLDLRSIIWFNAAVFIASYVILLALFRRYIGSYLTPIPTIVVGAIWFSVGDFQNSLWAFQMPWYLTVLFLFAMLFALLVPDDHRAFWVAIAVVAAMAGSISTVQGFLLWPLGVICILWNRPRARRALSETAAWCGALLVMLAVYLPGYNFNNNGCYPTSSCTVVSALHHPLAAIQTYFALIGSVIPGTSNVPTYFQSGTGTSIVRFEAVGAVLFGAVVFIAVQSYRDRSLGARIPLPLTLTAFGLGFDVMTASGRSAGGPTVAIDSNRYIMPNLILLTGIVIYAYGHIPPLRLRRAHQWRVRVTWLTLIALGIGLVAQVGVASEFGVTNARHLQDGLKYYDRFFVNLDRYPKQDRACELGLVAYFLPVSILRIQLAAEDKLGEFQPTLYRHYRSLGPPVALLPECSKAPVAPRPEALGGDRRESRMLVGIELLGCRVRPTTNG